MPLMSKWPNPSGIEAASFRSWREIQRRARPKGDGMNPTNPFI